jgi:prevent-host-death family protein
MTIINSADLRNNLSVVLEKIAATREPVVIGRFGQPKAVLVDAVTYNWQSQILDLISRIDTLTKAEIETLNILLDKKTREMLLAGLQEAASGEVISLEKFLDT